MSLSRLLTHTRPELESLNVPAQPSPFRAISFF